jgi:uncharacterized protein (TIGR00255 family)
MTGFGRGVAGEGRDRLQVTIQGWNHRNADLVFRLPEPLRGDERGLREIVLAVVARGRCEIAVRRATGADASSQRQLDAEAVRRFAAEAEPLIREGLVDARWSLGDLARGPFTTNADEAIEDPALLREVAAAALRSALDEFEASRTDEGARLRRTLELRLTELSEIVDELEERCELSSEELEGAIREKLDLILPGGSGGLPAERIAQEVVLLADRSDVREELDRLHGHLAAAREFIAGSGPHGRRLDFLVQEVLRELNTLGSKSRDAAAIRRVVDAKVINERLREQIQNVE